MTTMDKVGNLEQISIEALIPYARNSRTHSDAQIAQIAASIREFGFTNPILIDGSDNIIAGHGRVLAARKLGLEDVPCLRLTHLSDAQKKAYVIADNKLALNSGWDFDLLKLEVQELESLNYDVSLLGFHPSELNFEKIDYSILDDEDLDAEIREMASSVKKAIQIEFEPEHYIEAQEIIKWWRDQDAYIGYMILDFLRKEKEKA